jgi:hypothetical protein
MFLCFYVKKIVPVDTLLGPTLDLRSKTLDLRSGVFLHRNMLKSVPREATPKV